MLVDRLARLDLPVDQLRPVQEQLDRSVLRQRVERVFDLGREPERHPARHEEPEPRCIRQQARHFRRGAHHVLEVVQHDQRFRVLERLQVAQLQGLNHGRDDEIRIRGGRQRDEEDAVGVLLQNLRGDLKREPRLARRRRCR